MKLIKIEFQKNQKNLHFVVLHNFFSFGFVRSFFHHFRSIDKFVRLCLSLSLVSWFHFFEFPLSLKEHKFYHRNVNGICLVFVFVSVSISFDDVTIVNNNFYSLFDGPMNKRKKMSCSFTCFLLPNSFHFDSFEIHSETDAYWIGFVHFFFLAFHFYRWICLLLRFVFA